MKRLPLLAAAALLAVGAPAPALAATDATALCDATARLDWGFKESFRAYIDGSIANGGWEVSDGAAYESPFFLFPGEGEVAPNIPLVTIGFIGTVNFTGHGGLLDTTIANPTLSVGVDEAVLLLDVTGVTMEGDEVREVAVPFVEIDLAGQDLDWDDDVVAIVAAPTALTQEGAEAFPNYPAGESFDPISVTVDTSGCDEQAGGAGGDGAASGPDLPAVLTVSGILLVIATVIAAVRLRRPEDAGPRDPLDR